jgi:hypothetical protein
MDSHETASTLQEKKLLYVVKPCECQGGHNNYPRFLRCTTESYSSTTLCSVFRKIRSYKDLESYYKKHDSFDRFIIQPFIDGTILGINFIGDNGKMIDYSIYETIDLFYNKKSIRNVSFVRRLDKEEIEQKVVAICRNIIEITKYQGIGVFEVLWNKKDNTIKLMDFNPRISYDFYFLYKNKGSFATNYIKWMLELPPIEHKHYENNTPRIVKRHVFITLQRVFDQDFLSLFHLYDWIYLFYIFLLNFLLDLFHY